MTRIQVTRRGADAPILVHASLLADGWETPYVRSGTGSPLLLLGDPADPIVQSLVTPLAGVHRVIVPEVPGVARPRRGQPVRPPTFASWLRHFLDGIGLPRATLVLAHSEMVGAALAFALSEPSRVSRVVVLFASPGGESGAFASGGALGGAASVLLVPRLAARGKEALEDGSARIAAEILALAPGSEPTAVGQVP
jgi:pimeloyl-ACP methyl ester carboxylesterase